MNNHKPDIKIFGVKRLGLFGSVVRNESYDKSDIDFIVEFFEGEKIFKQHTLERNTSAKARCIAFQ